MIENKQLEWEFFDYGDEANISWIAGTDIFNEKIPLTSYVVPLPLRIKHKNVYSIFTVLGERIGEAYTLKDAKQLAQEHFERKLI